MKKLLLCSIVSILTSVSYANTYVQTTCTPEYVNVERSRHDYKMIGSNHSFIITNNENRVIKYHIGYELWTSMDGKDRFISSHGIAITLAPGQSYGENYHLSGGAKFPEKGHFKTIGYTRVSDDKRPIQECKEEGKIRVY